MKAALAPIVLVLGVIALGATFLIIIGAEVIYEPLVTLLDTAAKL